MSGTRLFIFPRKPASPMPSPGLSGSSIFRSPHHPASSFFCVPHSARSAAPQPSDGICLCCGGPSFAGSPDGYGAGERCQALPRPRPRPPPLSPAASISAPSSRCCSGFPGDHGEPRKHPCVFGGERGAADSKQVKAVLAASVVVCCPVLMLEVFLNV